MSTTPKHRVIIDTDPGVDDVLALLLALSASPEDLEVALISVTYGNVPLHGCLRNAVALFHVLEKELEWRRETGRPEGFGALRAFRPIVAVGAEHPLQEEALAADHFHGVDGLHGVHDTHPDLSPADTWRSLFPGAAVAAAGVSAADADADAEPEQQPPSFSSFFTPSRTPAHLEMLRILRESPAGTVTVVAVGPLTNVALAAAEDPETLMRAREVVVMGGAVHAPGNITPVAEFNTFADPVAAARVFALTSASPASTMPPPPPPPPANTTTLSAGIEPLPAYPAGLTGRLRLTLFPLDITTPHLLTRTYFEARMAPLLASGSPLARWVETVMSRTFDKIDGILRDGSDPGLSLHDPLTIWYMMTRNDPAWTPAVPGSAEGEDIRIETGGQWTRGMHVADGRGWSNNKTADAAQGGPEVVTDDPADPLEAVQLDEVPGHVRDWAGAKTPNRINRIVGSPGESLFAEFLMKQLFW
ncbi:hypothetical protein RB594_005390 [Gaeumannomyces avenae]